MIFWSIVRLSILPVIAIKLQLGQTLKTAMLWYFLLMGIYDWVLASTKKSATLLIYETDNSLLLR